jgi:uncharacterized protein with PIN domain
VEYFHNLRHVKRAGALTRKPDRCCVCNSHLASVANSEERK